MKLVFCILSHKKPDSLFLQLLSFLNKFKDVTIVVHHDNSQSEFDETLIENFNIQMVHPSFKTKWGHISKIPAMIGCYKKAYEVTPDLDWLITLSTNCFPIKAHDTIIKFFENSAHDYYMESHPLGPNFEGIYKWHYQTLFTKHICKIPFFTRKGKFYWKHLRTALNKSKTAFKNYTPYTGADWFFLNNKTTRRIIDADIPNHPITQHVAKQNQSPDMNASPDEIIIQTFVKNQSDLNGCDNYYRYINWKGTNDWHPNTLTMDYWEDIKKSDALFARKFDKTTSNELITKLNTEIIKS